MPLVAVADLVNSGAVAVGADAVGGELSVAADAPHVLKAVAAIAGLSLPLAPESLGRPVGVRGASIGVGSNAGAVTIAGLSLPLAETLRRPISIGGASVGVGSNGRTTIAITGLSLPLAKAAKAGLIDVSTTITIGADSVGGELGISTIDAGHSLVAATITIAGLSLPLAETLRRPISIGRATIGVGSNAAAVSVAIAGLSLSLAKTLRRPISIGRATIGVGSNAAAISVAIAGLGLPLAKTAKLGLIDISTTITIGANSVGGELGISTIEAGHSLVAATISISGLSLPLAETLRRPISIGRATIGVGSNASAVSVVGWVGEGASREGEDEDLKHSTDTNSFFLSQPMHNTYNLGRHDLAY